MATKTISIDLEAYRHLVEARLTPDESFSRVIKRAEWKAPRKNGAALLEAILQHEPMTEEALHRIEQARRDDHPPLRRWT